MKPSKRVMREAADLLACCASQPDDWRMTTGSEDPTYGTWSNAAVTTASLIWEEVNDSQSDMGWREHYAEAEAHIRKKLETM